MKRSAYCFLALIALIIVGCHNETDNFDTSLRTEATLVFKATNETVSPGTKTVRLDDGSVWWKPAEEISVFYGSGANGGSKFTSKNTTLAEIVEFEGSIAMSGSNDFWAVYPYSGNNSCDGNSVTLTIPANQTGVEGDFSDNCFPTVAKSKTLDLSFWNVCGGVKFFVSRSDIKSVKIKGNNNEPLAGTVKVAFDEHGKPAVTEIVDGATEVMLTAPGGNAFEAGKYYHITCLPTALPDGITMTFSAVTEEGTLISENAQTIKRSVFGVLRNVDSNVSEWVSIMPIPEAVDLGLSVNWASFNVGASKPEEYGNYYAWGETEPKTGYFWSTYKYSNESNTTLTKYCDNSRYGYNGFTDNKTVLDLEDDVVHVKLGGSWRMPTDAEWTELRNNCTWKWTTQNGVKGCTVTSNTNGNSIFLPAAGNRDGTGLKDVGSWGYYWSYDLRMDCPDRALTARFQFTSYVYKDTGDHPRYYGQPVRPVYDPATHVTAISLNHRDLTFTEVSTVQILTAVVLPSHVGNKSVIWSSSNTAVATVAQDGKVTSVGYGMATITATTEDGGLTATCNVRVITLPEGPVDLGLSVKWASCNIGATTPEEYGNYYAWGETETKTTYNYSTYKYCNGSYKTLTKYCDNSRYGYNGFTDNKTALDLEDDVARVKLGGNWRMPADAEWTELRGNCTWTRTTQNCVNGYLVTSNTNGNSIFLPAAGIRYYEDISLVGSYGYYWSSSLTASSPYNAWCVSFYSSGIDRSGYGRYYGQPVRPVTE